MVWNEMLCYLPILSLQSISCVHFQSQLKTECTEYRVQRERPPRAAVLGVLELLHIKYHSIKILEVRY